MLFKLFLWEGKAGRLPRGCLCLIFKGFQILPVLVLCLGSGCRLVPPLGAVNLESPGWSVREGQAVWQPKTGAPEMAGELLLASGPNQRTFVQFSKNPFPFMVGQLTTNSWEIQLPTMNKRYSGRGQPPKRLILLYLPGLLAGKAAPKGWVWQWLDQERWRVENPRTGESLEGFAVLKPRAANPMLERSSSNQGSPGAVSR